MRYPHLFEPIRLNQVLLRNRIVSTAHAEVYAEGGNPTERYIRYYEEKAKGGVGLAICGGSSPVSPPRLPPIWLSSTAPCPHTLLQSNSSVVLCGSSCSYRSR